MRGAQARRDSMSPAGSGRADRTAERFAGAASDRVSKIATSDISSPRQISDVDLCVFGLRDAGPTDWAGFPDLITSFAAWGRGELIVSRGRQPVAAQTRKLGQTRTWISGKSRPRFALYAIPSGPIRMKDAENWRPSETAKARGRAVDDFGAFGLAPAKAEAMRMIVAASAEERNRRAGGAATRGIANPGLRSDLGRKYLCVTASFRPARIGIWAIDNPALTSRRQSVKKAADLRQPVFASLLTRGDDGEMSKRGRISAGLYAGRQRHTATADARE